MVRVRFFVYYPERQVIVTISKTSGAYLRSKFVGNAKEITQFFRGLSLSPVDDRLISEIAGKLISGSGAVLISFLRLTRAA
jgi:hypothetical protein